MANQYNYAEKPQPPLSARYSISRIMSFPTDETIQQIVPAEFGFYPNEYVEMCLYNPTDQTLVASQRIELADNAITVTHLVYSDGTYQNYLVADFTKINELYPTFLIPGVFDLVINVFEDMIGRETLKKMSIEAISVDRTEVRMKFDAFFGSIEQQELNNVVYKSIPKPFLGGITDNLLVTSQQTGDPTIGITADEVLQRAQESNAYYSSIVNLGLEPNFTEVVARIMTTARDKVLVRLQNSKYRLRQQEYDIMIEEELVSAFEAHKIQFDSQVIVT